MQPIFAFSGLNVSRGDKAILRDVHWCVRPGEHWAILGPNGCGKTSLLKVLLGYLSPTSGEFELLGHHYGACDWREPRGRVGIVTSALQASIPVAEPALETVISGRYAQLDLWVKITRADIAAGKRWLKFVGAADLADREWQYLSQGERQRVLIARALMGRPRLLILDEPCAGLDPVARQSFLRIFDQLTRQPHAPTLIIVTHHTEEIGPEFTHALMLRAGKVVAQGPIATTLTARNLSTTFGQPMSLRRLRGEWRAWPR
ncbi:MAG: ABC transporter ATP-binding protein [Opitutae bacterium]|nr:ABC transporter ATP-binding protein [Opitutae bacterium]